MSLLITGGTGFLGPYLAEHALDNGERVVLFDRDPRYDRLERIIDRVDVVAGDVLEPQELVGVMDRFKVTTVAHLAFLPGAPHPERVVPYLRVQCIGTANVFEVARLCGVRRVVNASSVAVYGHDPPSSDPMNEDDPARPDEPYGACKLWSEHVAAFYATTYGMEILSLRVSSSMGVGRLEHASLATGLMTRSDNFMTAPELAALGHPVTMPPDAQVSDFLYAADTAAAFWLALTRPKPAHRVFNLRAEQRPIGDMSRCLRSILPKAKIEVSESSARRLQLMDNTRIVTELGFSPRYTLEQGVEDYVGRILRGKPGPNGGTD